MISALVITASNGEIIVMRAYKDNITRAEVQAFCSRSLPKAHGQYSPISLHNGAVYAHVPFGDVIFVAVTKENANACLLIKFLYKFSELLRAYFGGTLDDNEVRKNFVLVYELLDECLDLGYPQVMERDILKRYITQAGGKVLDINDEEALKQITVAATGATPWRQEGIKHKKNEVYIDVIESVNMLVSTKGTLLSADVQGYVVVKCFLSGMPECKFGMNDKLMLTAQAGRSAAGGASAAMGTAGLLSGPASAQGPKGTPGIAAAGGAGGGGAGAGPNAMQDRGVIIDNVRFHQCVRLSKFDSERAITFVPPDGTFELMSYRIADNTNCPFRIFPVYNEKGRTKLEVTVKLKAVFDKELFATNVICKIPTPDNTAAVSFPQISNGKAKYESASNCIFWRLRRFNGEAEHIVQAEIDLVSVATEKHWVKPPISLDFQVPMYTASGLRVRFLRIQEKSNYKPIKWIRYITKAGTYQQRVA